MGALVLVAFLWSLTHAWRANHGVWFLLMLLVPVTLVPYLLLHGTERIPARPDR